MSSIYNLNEKVKQSKGKINNENDTSITKAESEDEDRQQNKYSRKNS